MSKFWWLVLASFVFSSPKLWALPEAVRHSYINCNSCHFSPSGGGALNAYGRALSQEVFGTFKANEKSFYGILPKNLEQLSEDDKLVVAAFFRGLQYRKTTPTDIYASLIPMQADIELGYNSAKWALIGTVGQQSIDRDIRRISHTFSRRHYILFRANENHFFRAGRFLRPYGLQDPDHTLYVRRDLNFGFDSETYNLEYGYQIEDANFLFNYSFGNFDNRFARTEERGLTISASHLLWEKSKVGVSAFTGQNHSAERIAGGAWSILSYSDSIFSSFEADLQSSRTRATVIAAHGPLVRGYAISHKLHAEVYKAVVPFFLAQQANTNTKNGTTKKQALGLGAQWFVAPHLELLTELQREFLYSAAKPKADTMFVMLHWYL